MAEELNIITSDSNNVSVTTEDSIVTIVENGVATNITIPQSEITTIQIATIGPQGPKGNDTSGSGGIGVGFPFSGSAVITGSLFVTDGITGSFSGTMYGYVENIQTSSLSVSISNINTTTASLNISVSNLNLTTASLNSSVSNLNSTTESLNNSISNLNSTTESLNNSISNINNTTSNLDSSINNLNIFSASVIQTYATTGSNTFIGNQTITGSLNVNNTTTLKGNIIYPQLDKAGYVAHNLTGRAQAMWAQLGYIFVVDYINKTISVWRQDINYVLTNVIDNYDLTADIVNIGFGPQQIWGDGTNLYIQCAGGGITKWEFNTGTEELLFLADNNDNFAYQAYGSHIWGVPSNYIYTISSPYIGGSNSTLKAYDINLTDYVELQNFEFNNIAHVYALDNSNIFVANHGHNFGIRRFTFDGDAFTYEEENTGDYGIILDLKSDGTYLFFVALGLNGDQSLLYAISKSNLNATYYSIDLTSEFGGANINNIWCDDQGLIWVSDGVDSNCTKLFAYTFDGTNFTKVSYNEYSPNNPVQIINTMSEYYVLDNVNLWVNSKTLIAETYEPALIATGSIILYGGITASQNIVGNLNGTASWANNYNETDPIYNAEKGKYITTGSSETNQIIKGSLTINQNLTVLGSQSVQYVTSSQLNITTNLITVNTATPAVRFGGLAVYDSGSTGKTGSILWDSEENVWIYTNPSGGFYDGAMFLVGPRSAVAGTESPIKKGYAAVGDGSHHMTSSQIYSSESVIRLETNTWITGSLNVSLGITGSLSGSVVGYVANIQTASLDNSIGNINSTTASLNSSVSNLNLTTASLNSSVSNLNLTTASLNSSVSNLNLTTASFGSTVTSIVNKTGSFATTGSNTFIANQTISGSVIATSGFTGSFSGSFVGNGSGLTGVGGGISQGKVVAILSGLSNLF